VRAWEAGSTVFFVYLGITALVRGRRRGTPARALTASIVGLLLSAASLRTADSAVLHSWLLPPVLLLTAYWGTGALFDAPMPRIERLLRGCDEALGIRSIALRAPRGVAELLEIAYSGVYLVIPLALWIALAAGETAVHFWTVVLYTDYICFGCLPWIQSRPPRALEGEPPWQSRWRALNLQILESASVRVNTFPSGHAAEGLACALLVTGSPWPVVIAMFVNAAAIAAGAVFGRYHYALDAIFGWIVAVIVWLAA
jgi:membrane-associated phospholipid phosphatase